MHQSKGHSSSLVLTIRQCELWNSTLVYWLIIDSEPLGAHQSGPDNPAPPSVQSHGLHTIPSPVASNNAACPRWKIANQDSDSKTGCGDSSANLVASKLEASVLPDTFPSRLPPSSPPPSHYCGVLNLWHRDTFIHHGSAIFIASGFVTRVYCLNKLPCAPQRSFFEASADRDELERDVAWLVTALQKVVSDLVVKPTLRKLIVPSQAHFGISMNRRTPSFLSLESNATRTNILSDRAPLYNYDCMLSVPST
ncbi:unnamed protein product [Penicillium nalgiovense]|nr:unnamed protein product [Penicillium nalgiovense]